MSRLNQKRLALLLSLVLALALLPGLLAQAGSASLSGLVQTDSSNALENAEITLIKVAGASESIAAQAKSNADGQWQFSNLEAGDYYVQVSLPDGFYHAFSDSSPIFPAKGRHSRSGVLSLSEGQNLSLTATATKKSSYINLIAFFDQNMNGGRMSSEPFIRDVEVDLLYTHNGLDYVITSGKTDKEGNLQIRELTSATYKIRVRMPQPYIVGPIGSKINPFYNVVNPQEANTGTSAPFFLDRSLGMGIGGVMATSLTGRVFMDSNMNGLEDAGEGGYPGLDLTLSHQGMGIEKTITTTENSEFRFDYLQAGEYTFTAELPDGVMFALPGSSSVFHDGFAQSQSVNINVTEDKPATLAPLGIMPASAIRLFAFLDSNVNGLLDESEPPFMNAQVEILVAGQVMASANTDAQGQAYFPRVRDGEVDIRVSLPDSQIFTISGGEEGNAFSDLTAQSSLTVKRLLQRGQTLSVYAGATLPATITGTLFEDSNLNSIRDNGEMGLSGFSVSAVDAQGNIAAQAVTDAEGRYALNGLVPANYKVRFALITPFVFSDPSQATTGQVNKVSTQTVEYGETQAVTAGPGALVESMDAGAFRSAVIMGAVLLGDEEIGFSEQAQGLTGVSVVLLDENKQPVSEHTVATTDAMGRFSLKGALPGNYYLAYALPEGAKFSQPLMEETTFVSELISVKASDELTQAPLYAVLTASIKGQAFVDNNFDGAFDSLDSPLPLVSMDIINQRTDEVYTVKSDETGAYHLTGIRPGSYSVLVTLPDHYAIDANAKSLVPASIEGESTAPLTLQMGQKVEDTLIPALIPLTIKGSAFYDNDLSLTRGEVDTPYQTKINLMHLRTQSTFSLETDGNGNFESAPAFPGAYQVSLTLPGDHVLTAPEATGSQEGLFQAQVNLTQDNPSLELAVVQFGRFEGAVWNMDGSQKDIGGLEVSLLKEDGSVLATAQTGTDGKFAFLRLYPKNYRLSVTLKEGYRFARELDTQVRPSVILSDLVGLETATGQSELIPLLMGEKKTAQDIGMGSMGKLGDFAWLDLDADGMQDKDEPGIPGLSIKLYQYGHLTAQAVTDPYGRYLFENLFPGSYTLIVDMPAEIKPTKRQTDFLLVASVLSPTEEVSARADDIIVPSGGRNLNADLGFVLRKEGVLPELLKNLPVKDWTRVNQQQPKR